MKDNRLYLSNIKECIEQIESYTVDGKETFLQNRMIQDAVIRNCEIIGEATKRLSLDFRAKYPDIPWQQMAGFRDILIHDYSLLKEKMPRHHKEINFLAKTRSPFKRTLNMRQRIDSLAIPNRNVKRCINN